MNWSRRAHFDTLLISTDRKVGLQAAEIDQIREFCEQHSLQVKEEAPAQEIDVEEDPASGELLATSYKTPIYDADLGF